MMWRCATACLLRRTARPCTASSCLVPIAHVTRCSYFTQTCTVHAPQEEAKGSQKAQREHHDNSSRTRSNNSGKERRRKPKYGVRQHKSQAAQKNNNAVKEHNDTRKATSGHTRREGVPPRVPADILTAAAAAQPHNNNDNEKETNSNASLSSSSAKYAEKMGWSYERVDPKTGTTALEDLYGLTLARIHAILEQPLPHLPQDGQVNPDFFIGFGYYSYNSRDVYRAALARELELPVQAIKLSVAWSGRFNVARFNRVQKVCGVVLDRTALSTQDDSAASSVKSTSNEASNSCKEEEDDELPAVWKEKVRQLVTRINRRRDEELLRLHLVQASEPIPEVRFSAQRREHRLLVRLHAWLKRAVLTPNLIVVVYGGNSLVRHSLRATSANDDNDKTSTSSCVINDALLQRDADEAARQRHYITERWLRLFHARQTVPQVLSITTIASLLAQAVLQGELASVTVPTETSKPTEETLLDMPTVELLRGMRELLRVNDANNKGSGEKEANANTTPPQQQYSVTDAFAPSQLRALSATQQVTAVQWLRLTRRALLLTEHSVPQGMSADTTSSSVVNDTAFTLENADGDMPALFVHAAYAGGPAEMHYLQHNAAAMNALLLHPHDITMKKSFRSRLRSGHRRLRLYEEAASDYTGG